MRTRSPSSSDLRQLTTRRPRGRRPHRRPRPEAPPRSPRAVPRRPPLPLGSRTTSRRIRARPPRQRTSGIWPPSRTPPSSRQRSGCTRTSPLPRPFLHSSLPLVPPGPQLPPRSHQFKTHAPPHCYTHVRRPQQRPRPRRRMARTTTRTLKKRYSTPSNSKWSRTRR